MQPRKEPLLNLSTAISMLPVFAAARLLRRPQIWDSLEEEPHEYAEKKRLKSAIRAPRNAWSALAYWIVGVWVVERAYDRHHLVKCIDAQPLWHMATGAALAWASISTALFFASLAKRLRWLCAGANLSAALIALCFSVQRAMLRKGWAQQAQHLPIAAGVGVALVHGLALRKGHVAASLPAMLLVVALLEWAVLSDLKSDADALVWAVGGGLLLAAAALHAIDVGRARLPAGSLARQLAAFGHPLCHVASAGGVALLLTQQSEDRWCRRK